MIQATTYQLTARCVCGRVLLKLMGAPIVTVICYCDDCQEGARRIESMPDASPVKDADGGTPYLAYRRDRLEFAAGREYLLAHKLRPASTTHRVIASCCHSAMYLGFEDSKPWVDVYRSRLQGAVRLWRCAFAQDSRFDRRPFRGMCRATPAIPLDSSHGSWQPGLR